MPYDPIFDTTALDIAADDAYSVLGDPYDNSAVKVEPSLGAIAQGLLRPGKQVGAQHYNWLLSQFAGVMSALIGNDVIHEVDIASAIAVNVVQNTRLSTAENWMLNLSPRLKLYSYLATGTFGPGGTFVPKGRVTASFSFGCGGGGGGGKGGNGAGPIDNRWLAGAGGGGGAALNFKAMNLNPALLYTVAIGAGGLGATTSGSIGGDGDDTRVFNATESADQATFYGAQAGRGGIGAHAIYYWVHHSWGGYSRRTQSFMLIGPAGQGIRWDTATGASSPFGRVAEGGPHSLYLGLQPGQGGFGSGGSPNPVAASGQPGLYTGFAGGVGGTQGADLGDARGGGGGGGGGGGAFGVGGYGGNGGNAIQDPFSVGSAAANTGGGGGGGGSLGYKPTGYTANVRSGGNGGSGRAYILTVEEPA